LEAKRRNIADALALCSQIEWDAAYNAGKESTIEQAIAAALEFIASPTSPPTPLLNPNRCAI
jgi:hypothetical protein